MSNAPKIVHDRLRAAEPLGAHPGPDVLTAFVEQALSAGERDGVIGHLATCHECREIVALSTPAVATAPWLRADQERIVAAPARDAIERHPNWLTWPNLHWVAVAAGIVVVASILMLPNKKQPNMIGIVNEQAERPVAPPVAEKVPLEETAARAAPSTEVSAGTAKPDEFRLRGQAVGGVVTPVPAGPPAPGKMQSLANLGEKKREDAIQAGNVELDKLAMKDAAPAVAASVGKEITAPSRELRNSETVEVSPAPPVVAQAQLDDQLQARNEPSTAAIEKAKAPARDFKSPAKTLVGAKVEARGASSNYGLSDNSLRSRDAQWKISEGSLERSFDSGSSWQTLLHPEHSLLCHATRGAEIWAGGQAGTLFRSLDGGMTWTTLHPSTNKQVLSSDITAIQMGKPGSVTLITPSGESWNTSDGGKTWEKK